MMVMRVSAEGSVLCQIMRQILCWSESSHSLNQWTNMDKISIHNNLMIHSQQKLLRIYSMVSCPTINLVSSKKLALIGNTLSLGLPAWSCPLSVRERIYRSFFNVNVFCFTNAKAMICQWLRETIQHFAKSRIYSLNSKHLLSAIGTYSCGESDMLKWDRVFIIYSHSYAKEVWSEDRWHYF